MSNFKYFLNKKTAGKRSDASSDILRKIAHTFDLLNFHKVPEDFSGLKLEIEEKTY